jgi:PilZ domain-containing protein
MPQPRSKDPLRRAISKLVIGLEKREHIRRERRRHNRYSLQVKVHLCTRVGGNQYQNLCEAWASDLSVGGVCLLAEQSIDTEETIYINFEEVLGYPCYIPVVVHRCRPLFGSIYQVNSQFVYDVESGPGPQAQVA